MLADKNEEVRFKKSPWNASCKNGFLLKIPLFSKPNFKENFSIKHHKASFCTVNSLLMLQKPLGHAINKFGRFYRVPKKSSFSRKLKIQNLSHGLKQRLFCQKLFLIPNFDYLSKNGKGNWISVVLSCEVHYLSTGQGLSLSPMENYQVFL